MFRIRSTPAYVPSNREILLREARRNVSVQMKALLRGTTRAQNDAMLLVYVSDLTQEEAATVLGVAQPAIAQRIKGAVALATKNLFAAPYKKVKAICI